MKQLSLLMLMAGACLAQPAFVTTATCGTGGTNCNMTSVTVQTGDLILVQVTTSSCPGANTQTATDGTNTYTHITGSPWTGSGINDCVVMGILKATAAGNATLTVNCNDTNSSGFLGCMTVVYRLASIGIDRIAQNESYHFQNCASGQPACVPVTGTTAITGNANETLVCFFGSWASASGTWTVGSGFTQRQQITGSPIPLGYIQDKTVSSKATYSGSVTQVVTGASPQQASTLGVIVTLGATPFNYSAVIHHRVVTQ